jgi:hypothetical protein
MCAVKKWELKCDKTTIGPLNLLYKPMLISSIITYSNFNMYLHGTTNKHYKTNIL